MTVPKKWAGSSQAPKLLVTRQLRSKTRNPSLDLTLNDVSEPFRAFFGGREKRSNVKSHKDKKTYDFRKHMKV